MAMIAVPDKKLIARRKGADSPLNPFCSQVTVKASAVRIGDEDVILFLQ